MQTSGLPLYVFDLSDTDIKVQLFVDATTENIDLDLERSVWTPSDSEIDGTYMYVKLNTMIFPVRFIVFNCQLHFFAFVSVRIIHHSHNHLLS